ncbi:reverse transcriptase domain-containing protein [Terriglobus sp. ADX1]|uniref:reverse transcriptase domain-containing protein n=1 Tax=Terriglobus sp. ADX1 TaxID=2794063 RepID=UPI002FE5EEC0
MHDDVWSLSPKAHECAACFEVLPAGSETSLKKLPAIKQISTVDSLQKAWKSMSRKNKHSYGADRVTLKAFASDLGANLIEISKSLSKGTYQFQQLRPAVVKKAGTNKFRPIQIPAIRDRVVMKALARHIQPSFAKFDLPCSFAFIKGRDRGVKAAIAEIQKLNDAGYIYYFEADIINFFGSVDRKKLWKMFSARIREKSLLPMLEKCFNLELDDLQSYQVEHQEIFLGATEGIPQGGVLSPLLANFYLHQFDKRVTSKGFQLVRYADDFVVMCKTAEEARAAHIFCRNELKKLGLSIHDIELPASKTRLGNFRKDGLAFLGVRFEGKNVYPDTKVVKRFKEKVSASLHSSQEKTLPRIFQGLSNLIVGWGRGYQEMKVTELYRDLDAYIKVEVIRYLNTSGIQLRGRNIRKQLKFLGIPSLSAMVVHGDGNHSA